MESINVYLNQDYSQLILYWFCNHKWEWATEIHHRYGLWGSIV